MAENKPLACRRCFHHLPGVPAPHTVTATCPTIPYEKVFSVQKTYVHSRWHI